MLLWTTLQRSLQPSVFFKLAENRERWKQSKEYDVPYGCYVGCSVLFITKKYSWARQDLSLYIYNFGCSRLV